MRCADVRELIDSFLSEQLLVETIHEVLRHVERCPTCRAELEGRRALRAALRRAIGTSEELRMRPEFAEALSSRLRAVSRRRSFPVFGWRAGLAIAAGVLLVISLGVAVRSRLIDADLAALARDAVGDHRDCVV